MGDSDAENIRSLIAARVPYFFSAPVAETVFWTGAGISADLPTGAPVGNALADRALSHAFAAGTLDAVLGCYRTLRLARQRPRLETLLDVVRRVHGLPVLSDLLSDLRDPLPNTVHGFFAEHVNAGGRHVTANFDPCIESAGAASGKCVNVIHFHGSFASDPTGEKLGATLASIERGFSADIRDRLLHSLMATPRFALIVAGYSGSDFFDADPFLQALPAHSSLQGASVLWVDHREGPAQMISGADAARSHRQLSWLQQAGAEVHQISAPTRLVLSSFATAWGVRPPAPPYGTPHQWQGAAPVTTQAREEATLELFSLMGLHKQVTGLLARRSPATTREWAIAAQTAWAAGRYRDAAAAWQQAHAGNSTIAHVARSERLGACQWIRGQYRSAYRTLRRAVHEASMLPDQELDLKVQVAETLGRIVVHMRRSPDTRLLASRRRRAFALSQLPSPGISQPSLGTHLRARVRSVRADLGAQDEPGTQWEESKAAFGEYEALHAQLNYRHAELRHAAVAGHAAPEQFRQLHGDFMTLGASGDAARVPLIPAAKTAFTIPETIRGIRDVDITWWHRCRLICGYLALRLLAKIQRHRQ